MFNSLPLLQKYRSLPLDSENAARAFSSSYTSLDWPVFSVGGTRPFRNIQGLKILSLQVNASWYNFNSKNNTFVLTEDGQPAVTVTIPVGNYNTIEIVGVLAIALSQASLSLFTYVVTLDNATQKLVIVNNTGITAPFTLTFGTILDTGSSNPRKLLGFDAFEITSSFFDIVNGDYLYAPDVVNVTGANYLYVCSRKLGPIIPLFLPRDAADLLGGNAGAQIAKIPINVNPWGTIVWADPHPQYLYDVENIPTLHEFDLYLTLGNSPEPLELNGGVISVEFGVIENIDAGNSFNAFGPGTNKIGGR